MATAQNELQSHVSRMGDHAKGIASEGVGMATDAGAALAKKAGEAAGYVGKKAEDATSSVGAGMTNLAGTIRNAAPSSEPIHTASGAVADTLETSGRYLQSHGLSGMGSDVTNLIRSNPITAVLVGIGVGYLIARATTAANPRS